MLRGHHPQLPGGIFLIGYTFLIVSGGAILIGLITGVLSVFFVARQQSIIGDAIAHSTLAGIAMAYLIFRQQSRLLLLIGALLTGLLAVGLIQLVQTVSRIKTDAAIGVVLSTLFGLGVALLSIIQKLPSGSQSGLKHYLFGNIAFLRLTDLGSILILDLLVLLLIGLFWKELKLITFDREYAKTLNIGVQRYELLILTLVVVTVVLGVEMIGVIMMAGLLIGPGIAARQWSNHFGQVVLLAAILGAVAGLSGVILSATISNLATGPTIIVIMGIIVFISIIFSRKGPLLDYFTYLKYEVQVDVHETMEHLSSYIIKHPRGCDIREFALKEEPTEPQPDHQLSDDLHVLYHLGYIQPQESGNWVLTFKGMELVEQMSQSWEMSQ